jgi:hypothetical protein
MTVRDTGGLDGFPPAAPAVLSGISCPPSARNHTALFVPPLGEQACASKPRGFRMPETDAPLAALAGDLSPRREDRQSAHNTSQSRQ